MPIVETEVQLSWFDRFTQYVHYNHIPSDIPCFSCSVSHLQRIGNTQQADTNRYQWGDNCDYGPYYWMKTNIQSSYRWDMASEQMKYAEVQAVSEELHRVS